MKNKAQYGDKFSQIAPQTLFSTLSKPDQEFIQTKAFTLRLTQQELRQICLIAKDLVMFKESKLAQFWPSNELPKKQQINTFRNAHQKLLDEPKTYQSFDLIDKPKSKKPNLVTVSQSALGFGRCPVASKDTHCCNLLTLDAVQSCGFDCSYCSIQSFYHQNEVRFDADFAKKLAQVRLDPNKIYHIGTGQSSDSLLWGNHNNNLAAICDFAAKNPNVILELKTKSKNIAWLLANDYPRNVICTWSLNPQEVIDFEEHQTASLRERITSARKITDKGRLVGFHFHPMLWLKNHAKAYGDIAAILQSEFTADEIAMISMGSLTYTKDVMRTIRKRQFHSKILQMPLQKVAGKYAYPVEIKVEMFKNLYDAFASWQSEVFFYLCMEPASLWSKIFGYDSHTDNHAFESAMKASYFKKMRGSQVKSRLKN